MRTTLKAARLMLLSIALGFAMLLGFAGGCGTSGAPAVSSASDGSTLLGGDGGARPSEDGGAHASGDGSANAGGDSGSTSLPHDDAGSVTNPPPPDGGTTTLGPINLASASVYSIYVPIFSAAGNLAGVTSQLARIRDLGFSVLYLLPVTTISTSTTTPSSSCGGAGKSIGSPYSVKDYTSVELTLGTSRDLVTLVSTAHGFGLHVILDEVLNHTAWDNPLVAQHPEYYLHCDGNRTNAGSIAVAGAGAFADAAQLDYITQPDLGLRAYVTKMVVSWVTTYDIDGFRFDTADDPYGSSRRIPLDFWEGLRSALLSAKPGLLLLGEEEDPDLAQTAFDLDYGSHLDGIFTPPAGGLQQVAKSGASSSFPATLLHDAWTYQKTGYPATMLHMSLLQDWDTDEDLNLYGGVAATIAAAAFDFTIDGVPMIFNGEEVGNDRSGVNTHTGIDWSSPNAAAFTPFYKSLLGLRNANPALQQGTLTWLPNSASGQAVSYTRSDSTGTFLALVNFASSPVTGSVSSLPSVGGWTDVSPTGSPGGTNHVAPPSFSLSAHDFAIFEAQ